MGLALYEEAQAFLQEQGAVQLKSEVQDDDAVSLHFAERNGFSLNRHLFASRLDLQTFDEAPYDGLIATQEGAGIRFCSMADFQDSLAARRKLYELNRSSDLDIPGGDGTFLSFSEEEVVRNYPGLTHEDIQACLAYASAVLRAEKVYPLALTEA